MHNLADLLDLPRVFGGQVAAQALVAAGRTVHGGRTPRSLHADLHRRRRDGQPPGSDAGRARADERALLGRQRRPATR